MIEAKKQILFLLRGNGPFCSIEELFASIRDAFSSDLVSDTITAPRTGASFRSIMANLLWAFRLQKADLVHVTGDIHYAALAVIGRPVVLTIHDLRFVDQSRGLRRFLFWLWWVALPVMRARRVTVISEFTKGRLISLVPFAKNKIRVVPNGVGAEFVPLSKQWDKHQPRILLVGTTGNKNLCRMAESCQGLPVRLAILGRLDDAQRSDLLKWGLKFEEFYGLSRKKVVALYQACDLVSFVSTYEGFGMPILEAQAVGRPVLTSDLSPMRDVAGSGACLVNPFEVKSIRAGLLQLIQDESLRDRLVAEGFRNVAQYSAAAVARQYAAIYYEVLGHA